MKEKALLRNLVKDENSDRRNFYAEYAKAKEIDSSQVKRVQKIFAERWIKDARPGWWIQNEDGGWVKKTWIFNCCGYLKQKGTAFRAEFNMRTVSIIRPIHVQRSKA